MEGLGALGQNRRYEIVRKLGSGGMGVVYEAIDRERGHLVAIKTLDLAEGEALYRFKNEFRALADVSHPNLVTLYDLSVGEELSYFTMELVLGVNFVAYNRGAGGRTKERLSGTSAGNHESGRSIWDADTSTAGGGLATIVDGTNDGAPPCDIDRLRETLPQLAGALAALHAAGWIHRDVKASNVMVNKAGRVVVLDFGLAADVDQRHEESHNHQLMGTIEYMSPEQAFPKGPLSAATDWYSVGVLLYEILVGRLPFEGKLEKILAEKRSQEPQSVHALVPSAPEILAELSTALLATDPTRRPTGPEVLRRLGAAMTAGERSGTFRTRPPESTPFSGRRFELETLEAALSEVSAGATCAAVLRGPSGIGKTELVREFLSRAQRSNPGAVVLRGRCYEREVVPYRAIDPLVDDLSSIWSELDDRDAEALVPDGAASLVKLFPVLSRVPALIGAREMLAIVDPQEVRKRGFDALRGVLRRLGAHRTLIVVLDDLQWVDHDTVLRLLELVRAPRAPRLLLLLAYREDSQTAPNPHMAALANSLVIPTRELPLAPMSLQDSIALAERLLPAELRDEAEHIARESAGLPLFAVELAEYAQSIESAESSQNPSAAPVRLDLLLRGRIEALSGDARTLLELVALAGEPIAQGTAARAGRIEAEDLRRELHALRVAKLVRTSGGRADDLVEPFHDRIRAAAIAGLTPTRQRALHGRLATALEREDAPAYRLAFHWMGASERQRATVYALKAGREAFDQLDFDRAAELYQTALTMDVVPADELAALRGAIAAALTNAGRPLEAAEAFRAAAEGVPAAQRLDLYRRSADQLLRGGYIEEGMAEMDPILRELGLEPHVSRTRALLSIRWGRARLALRGLSGPLRDETQIAMEELRVVDICWSIGSGLGAVEPIRGARFQLHGVHMALRLGERRRLARALAMQGIYFCSEGDEAGYQRVINRAVELGEDDLFVAGYTLLAETAHHYFHDNRWGDAVDRVDELCGVFHSQFASAGWEIDSAHLYAAYSMLYQGRLRELDDIVRTRVEGAERRSARYVIVNLQTRLGILHLAADAPDRAAEEIETAIATWPARSRGFLVQHFYATHSLCEVALYRGDPERAQELMSQSEAGLTRSQLLRVPMVAAEVKFMRGRIALALAASGQANRAAEARELSQRLQRQRLPIARPLGLLLAAGVAQVSGDESESQRLLIQAAAAFDGLDTNLLATAARWRVPTERPEAEAWFEREGVRAPGRMVALLAPGWKDSA